MLTTNGAVIRIVDAYDGKPLHTLAGFQNNKVDRQIDRDIVRQTDRQTDRYQIYPDDTLQNGVYRLMLR